MSELQLHELELTHTDDYFNGVITLILEMDSIVIDNITLDQHLQQKLMLRDIDQVTIIIAVPLL